MDATATAATGISSRLLIFTTGRYSTEVGGLNANAESAGSVFAGGP